MGLETVLTNAIEAANLDVPYRWEEGHLYAWCNLQDAMVLRDVMSMHVMTAISIEGPGKAERPTHLRGTFKLSVV